MRLRICRRTLLSAALIAGAVVPGCASGLGGDPSGDGAGPAGSGGDSTGAPGDGAAGDRAGGTGDGADGAPGDSPGDAPMPAGDTLAGDRAAGDTATTGDTPAAGDGGAGDPGTAGDAPGGDTAAGTGYRSSLAVCWTDANCPRAMAIGHGGLWNLSDAPYDSDAAIVAAYAGDMDGVKIDVRVTADNVPVIAHSSPIEIYESLDCYNRRIENMTAAQVTACHRLPSTTETFQRLDDVLDYLRGKMVAQLCVKEAVDFGRTIEEVHAKGAEDFAFIELSTGELQTLIPTLPGSDTVYYLVNVGSTLSEIDLLIDVIQHPGAFMVELDSTAPLGDLAATRLHPAGMRAFTYEKGELATVPQLQAFYDQGYDVLSANAAAQAVQARIAVNQARGVSPP